MEYIVKFSLEISSNDFAVIADTVFDIFNDPATRIDLAGVLLEGIENGTNVTISVQVTDASPGAALNRVKNYLVEANQPIGTLTSVSITRTDMERFI